MSFADLTTSLLPGEVPIQDVEYYHLHRKATEDDYVQRGFIQTIDDVMDFKRWIGESRGRSVLAFDTETTGLEIFKPGFKLRLAQFGTANEAWSINCERWPGIVREVLETYTDTPIVLHNAGYDMKVLQQVWPGFVPPWERIHDTMLYCRINDNDAQAGLKPVSAKLFGREAVAGQSILTEAMQLGGWTWETIPYDVPAYTTYGSLDTILTARLYDRLAHVRNSYTGQLEMDVLRIATAMEMRGMKVDRPYLTEQRARLDEYIVSVTNHYKDTHGINIRSNPQLADFFEKQGAVFTEFTDTGKAKLDKEVLTRLVNEGYGDAKHILDARKSQKLATTYFDNLLNYSDNSASVIHPQINTMAARTARQSVTSPALQTLPKNETMVRHAFIPHDGQKLVTCDYSQIELRLTAQLSEDEALRNAFRDCDATGDDFFTRLGKGIYGPDFEREDKRRTLIKNLTYGSAYGAGIPKMAHSAGVSTEYLEPIANEMFRQYPGIRGITQMSMTLAEANQRSDKRARPSITNIYGRKLYVDPAKMYTAANYLVQSSAGDELKRALVRLDYAGMLPYMLLSVHDEVIFSIPDEDIHEAMPIIQEAMAITTNMGYAIPIPADPEGPFTHWSKQ